MLGTLACIALLSAPASAAASGPRELEQPYVEAAGRPEVGETLSCYPGAWEGSEVTYTYEWLRDEAALASGPTHQITATDEGHWLSCMVSATDGEGTTTAHSIDSFFINPPREGPPRGGTIEGHVTNAANGQPIGGVKACAVNTDEGEPWDCVHTDASGHYAITVAEAGHFVVQFTVPPHSPYIARTFYGGTYSKSEASVLTIASGSTTTGIDLQLQEGGHILGVVTSASSKQPVASVEVCARESPAPCVLTNSAGEYELSGLATGNYTVQFSFNGSSGEHYFAPEYYNNLYFLNSISEANQVAVAVGHTVSGIDDELKEYASLSGRVTNASNGQAVADVSVDVMGSENGSADGGYATTNANGEYTVTGMHDPTGRYHVEFSPALGSELNFFPRWYDEQETDEHADAVTVPLGEHVEGVDAALREGGQITGRVTDAVTKQPLAEITVCAWSKVVFESRCAWTNSNGEYAIVRLPAEEFQVSFYTNSDNYYSKSYSGPVAVTLGHATAGIDAAMEPVVKGTIMGAVREAVWAKPIPNIDVCAYDIEQEELFGECTTSNLSGWYELRGLSAGQYIVEFSSTGPGLEYATQYYDKEPNPLYAEPVRITEGKFTSGIEGSLEKAGDASGRVTSAATGKPLQGIDVCYYARTEDLVGCMLTNAAGEYATPPVASGEYRVLFASPFESGLNYAAQFYGDVASINDSTYVTIEAGKLTIGIDAQMTAGARITGTVTSAGDGKAVEGALVCALPGFGEVGECALTHADGQYTIEGLAGGKYEVLFEAEGYRWQYYDDESLRSEARSVVVSAGATSEGIDAAMQPTSGEPPRNLQQPTVSGSAKVGDVLECSSGSWTENPVPSFTYNWLRNGHTNVGFGNTYKIQQADEGSSLQCEVTADSSAGSASAFSDPVNVPVPSEHGGPPPPPPVLVVRPVLPPASIGTPSTSGSQTVPAPSVGTTSQAAPAASISTTSAVYTYSGRRGEVFVDSGQLVRCPAGRLPCQIVVKVTARRGTRKLLLAYAQFDIPAGELERLRFKLDTAGAALLRDLKRIHTTVVATMRRDDANSVTVSRAIVLRSPPLHRRRS